VTLALVNHSPVVVMRELHCISPECKVEQALSALNDPTASQATVCGVCSMSNECSSHT
jgi:hypothetical protein